jgi:hypothetical protein
MSRLPRTLVTSAVSGAADLVMSVVPHGGQATARRNAWAGMSAGAARARARREAELAVAQAQSRLDVRRAR